MLWSDGESEFAEGCRKLAAWVYLHTEFVVSAALILDERVPGTDHLCRAEPCQAAHRPQPGLEGSSLF